MQEIVSDPSGEQWIGAFRHFRTEKLWEIRSRLPEPKHPSQRSKGVLLQMICKLGGEGGIRTLG
jgi:hypothetical protein